MKKSYVLVLFVYLFSFSIYSQAISLELNPASTHQMSVQDLGGGAYDISTHGGDPYVFIKGFTQQYDYTKTYYISFEYKASAGLDDLEVFYGPPIDGAHKVSYGSLAATTTYKTAVINMKAAGNWNKQFTNFRFDFGRKANETLTVKNIQLRKPTEEELQNDPAYRGSELADYLSATHKNEISEVKVTAHNVHITAKLPENNGNLYLCELKMYDNILDKKTFDDPVSINAQDKEVNITKDRFVDIDDDQYDRLYSRWIIAEKNGSDYTFKSYAHYATDIQDIAKWNLPEEKPASKKGVGGFDGGTGSINDLADLNLNNVTINVVLTSLISLTPTSLSYEFNDHTYYFNPSAVTRFDNTFEACANNNTMVSLILLIPRAASPKLQAIFNHPDANNGPYSMANVTSLKGTNYYAACVDFLSQRYYRPDEKYGKINHWIIHNEVDAGYYWTNAGKKSMEEYTDLYNRSMRTVYYTARKYNPTAKVFISLTHHWSKAQQSNYYAPQKMLKTLIDLSNKEGDFEWGVAYHPYPQDLRNPKAWNDSDISNDLNTSHLITPKNIELIDTWMRKKSSLFKKQKVRTLLFSEQGINTKSYDENDLQTQATGVAYMWKKFSRLPTLEGIMYHRRVDNSKEGGLLLGLWTTKPGTTESQDYKKPSWDVLKAANTSAEDDAFAFALPIIGVENWSAIYNPLAGEVYPQIVDFQLYNAALAVNNVKIQFDGEYHTSNDLGKAVFYNVASLSSDRTIRYTLDNQLIWPETEVVVQQDKTIAQNLSPADNVKATALSSTKIKLTWDDITDFEDGYYIERKTADPSSVFEVLDSVSAGITEFEDNTVVAGTEYQYRLRAYTDNVKTLPSEATDFLDSTLNVPSMVQKANENAKLYPNPAQDVLYFPFEPGNPIEDVSCTGLQSNFDIPYQIEYGKIKLDVSALENGIYFLTIETQRKTYHKKFMVYK